MKDLTRLKKEMCLGRLVWVQPPSFGSAVLFSKKLLNGLGIEDREMIYLSARQFVRYCKNGFAPDFLKATRVLLIGELEGLRGKAKRELLVRLSHHRTFKHRFDVSLVLVSPVFSDMEGFIRESLKPHTVSLFEDDHSIGIHEKIYEHIENASAKCAKPIWKITAEAAEYLESVFVTKGEDYLQRLILRAVKRAEGKELARVDINAANHFMISFESKVDTN